MVPDCSGQQPGQVGRAKIRGPNETKVRIFGGQLPHRAGHPLPLLLLLYHAHRGQLLPHRHGGERLRQLRGGATASTQEAHCNQTAGGDQGWGSPQVLQPAGQELQVITAPQVLRSADQEVLGTFLLVNTSVESQSRLARRLDCTV